MSTATRKRSAGAPVSPRRDDGGDGERREALPNGWRLVRYGELVSFVTSGPRGWAKYYSESGPLFLRVGNLDHASISLDLEDDQRVAPPGGPEAERTRVQPGDILVSVTADIGMVAVVPNGIGPAHISQHVALTRPKEDTYAPYLAWYLASEHGGQRQLRALQRGATKIGLGLDDIRAVSVPIPPVAEQRKIVAEIEKQFTRLDGGVAALKRVQANLKRYRAAVLKAACEGRLVPTEAELARREGRNYETGEQLLVRILEGRRRNWRGKGKCKEPSAPDIVNLAKLPEGWAWAAVPQVAECCLGKMLDKQKHCTGKRLTYLRNVNVRWGHIALDDLLEMYFEGDEVGRFSLRSGDVLVCEGGEPGRAAVWRDQLKEMRFQKALHRVRCHADIVPDYVVVVLEHMARSGRLERFFTGSTIKHFTGESLATMPLPLPPADEQERIVAEVERRLSVADETETAVPLNLQRATSLRQATLRRSFSER